MADEKSGAIEQAIDELFTDPDASENSDAARPPQTIDAEPLDADSGPKRG